MAFVIYTNFGLKKAKVKLMSEALCLIRGANSIWTKCIFKNLT